MKLSIVIICWNDAECLGPCLESIYAQKVPFEFEVIVSDNRSTDGSAELVRAKFPQVRLLVNESNLGFGPGNNAGAALAKGRYLLFLNPDTLLHENALERLVGFLDAHPEAGAVGPRVLNTDGTFQLSAHPLPSFSRFLVKALFLRGLGHFIPGFPADEYMGWKGKETRTVGFCAACALLLRTDLFRKLGGFDPIFKHQFEDTDLCCRIWQKDLAVYYYPEAEITHIRGANRGRYPLGVLEKAEFSKYEYFAKHFDRTDLLRLINLLHCSLRAAGLYLLGQKERARTFASLLAWHWKTKPLFMSLKQYLITKRSSLTGENHTFNIWFTSYQWKAVQPFLNPELPPSKLSIQEILPDHSPFEHEFLLTGTNAAERFDLAA